MKNLSLSIMKKSAVSLIAGSVVLLVSSSCLAQMQIPNPLIQPATSKAPQKNEANPPLPPGSAASYNGPRGMPESPYQMGGAGKEQAQTKSPFIEVRERLSQFYVSAIVGNSAILRRTAAPQSIGGTAGGSPQYGLPPSVAMGMAQQAKAPLPQGQTETLILTDGEPIDFLGDGISLTPKITANVVYVYYTQDGGLAKRSARRQVAFLGQVESTVASTPVPLQLFKPDPAYKQQVSVETKSRSSASNGNVNNSSASQAPGSLPAPTNFQQ